MCIWSKETFLHCIFRSLPPPLLKVNNSACCLYNTCFCCQIGKGRACMSLPVDEHRRARAECCALSQWREPGDNAASLFSFPPRGGKNAAGCLAACEKPPTRGNQDRIIAFSPFREQRVGRTAVRRPLKSMKAQTWPLVRMATSSEGLQAVARECLRCAARAQQLTMQSVWSEPPSHKVSIHC